METSASPGYSGTPLAKKLGYKAFSRAVLIGAPDDYLAMVEPLPEAVVFERKVTEKTELVHCFVTEREKLARELIALRKILKPDGAVWVSWPKKSAKVATDITEDVIREVALPLGYVDIKVCAVSHIWSGLKLVVRRELRGGAD
jgi:hypothetical protein